MSSRKENTRTCCICQSSPSKDPYITLHRFPKPSFKNTTRCELWAKYCYPNEAWSSPEFHNILYNKHMMLCSKHFRTTCFIAKKMFRTAVPDVTTCDENTVASFTSGEVFLNGATSTSSAPKRHQKKKPKKGGKKVESKPPPMEDRPAKRHRPDDTISPRGGHKRVKHAMSYSEAVGDQSVRVVIVTQPFRDLSEEQANGIMATLEEKLEEAIFEPNSYVPAFKGKPFLGEGALKMWCIEKKGVEWLQRVVGAIASPIPTTKLAVMEQSKIPRRVRCGLFIPSKDDVEKIRAFITRQNPWYNIRDWSLYDAQETEKGCFLMVGIPEEEIPKLKERERRVCYRFGDTYLRLYGEDKEEETPPLPPSGKEGMESKDKAGTSLPRPKAQQSDLELLGKETAEPPTMEAVAGSSRQCTADPNMETAGVALKPKTPTALTLPSSPMALELEELDLSDGSTGSLSEI